MSRRILCLVGVGGMTVACSDSAGGGGDGSSTAATSTATSTTAITDGTAQSTADSTQTTTAGPTDSGATGATTADDTGTDTTGVPECPYPSVGGQPDVALELVGSGFDRPVLALGHPTEPDRLYVAEQGGHVRILEPGATEAPEDSFLVVDSINADATTIGNEQGLLGFAFHPDFPSDGRVYVAYNPSGMGTSPPTVVEEYQLGGDGNADLTSGRIVIAIDQPNSNHNGGMIAFGPDGYLYIGTGDGGGGDNTYNTGQDNSVILAKMLRIGVEPDGSEDNPEACGGVSCNDLGPFDYTIPPDNPFVVVEGYAAEIYALGLRNPWRFSFDQANADLYVADVGQECFEEIDIIEAGANYGWGEMEGAHCLIDNNNACAEGNGCDITADPNTVNGDGFTMPLHELSSAGGSGNCSITGIGVYRSCEVEAWDGVYFYGDYCAGQLWGVRWNGSSVEDLGPLWQNDDDDRILGMGWNAWGDLYVTTVLVPNPPFFGDGRVYRVAPAM